mmetsp:Transcript_13385/g.15356  ORF Transcript_13385/g.15356 Transcript_13385/m.15356 type:complete len:267 (-) Transcript_13385:356-1156(-)
MIIDYHNNAIKGLERKECAEISVNNNDLKKYLHSTIKKQKDKKKGKVSFFPEANVTEVLHHKNYSTEEKVKCWYLKSDFIQIQKEFQETVQLMKAGKLEDDRDRDNNKHCFRGLEYQITERAFERRIIVKASRRQVFREQKIQRQHLKQQGGRVQELLGYAEKEIAVRNVIFSRYCTIQAYNMGLADEAEAFRIKSPKQNTIVKAIQSQKRIILDEHIVMNEEGKRKKLQRYQRKAPFSGVFQNSCRSFTKSYLSCTLIDLSQYEL